MSTKTPFPCEERGPSIRVRTNATGKLWGLPHRWNVCRAYPTLGKFFCRLYSSLTNPHQALWLMWGRGGPAVKPGLLTKDV